MKLTDQQRKTVASVIGEGVHTGLRKWCDSPQSTVAWRAIQDLPEGEWAQAVEMAVTMVVDYLDSAEFRRDAKSTAVKS